MATLEHDPTDGEASLVTFAQSTKRHHTAPSCQGIESSTRELQVSNVHTSLTVGSRSLGLSLIPFVLTSISNDLNIQMSKCQQFS